MSVADSTNRRINPDLEEMFGEPNRRILTSCIRSPNMGLLGRRNLITIVPANIIATLRPIDTP